MKDSMSFDGVCPFLMCLETGPHSHPICPECGAVRYGNLLCQTCRRVMNELLGGLSTAQRGDFAFHSSTRRHCLFTR